MLTWAADAILLAQERRKEGCTGQLTFGDSEWFSRIPFGPHSLLAHNVTAWVVRNWKEGTSVRVPRTQRERCHACHEIELVSGIWTLKNVSIDEA